MEIANSFAFDTYSAFEKLVKAGFTEKQAKAQIELQTVANTAFLKKELVTKEYLELKLKELEAKIMFKMAGLMITQTAVLTGIMIAVIKLL